LNVQKRVLIVDDDPNVLEVLNARLLSSGYAVQKAKDGAEAVEIINNEKTDIVISDVKMPGMDGLELLNAIRAHIPEMPVIFLTAYANIPEAVQAVKSGAVDYLEKPFEGQDLVKKIQDALNTCSVPGDEDFENVSTEGDFFWGESQAMKSLYDLVHRVAASDVNVMIAGESGVGKERVASLIHNKGPRSAKPFIVVDCGSTASGLLETELFGHAKGSFTHAISDKKGLIEAADKGTLFLDEIGNISNDMQVRLLRFLEERKIRRVGTVDPIPVDCRVISATNSDLLAAINRGGFRQDLYYRLRGLTITVPALRERKRDIPLLAYYFVSRYCNSNDLEGVTLPQETIDSLCGYQWPGNVRELKNVLEAGIVLCRDRILRPSDLQISDLSISPGTGSDEEEFSIEKSERNTIIRALEQTGGVQKRAADLLGISRRAIHYKVRKYDIDVTAISRSYK
jgi:DNA-binding NtrC family response regulator